MEVTSWEAATGAITRKVVDPKTWPQEAAGLAGARLLDPSRAKALAVGEQVIAMVEPAAVVTYSSERLPPGCPSRRAFAEWCRTRVAGASIEGKTWTCTEAAWVAARKGTPRKRRAPKVAPQVADVWVKNGLRRAG